MARVCDIRDCTKPANEIIVETRVVTPCKDDPDAADVEISEWRGDLCRAHQKRLYHWIDRYLPDEDNAGPANDNETPAKETWKGRISRWLSRMN